MKPSVNCPFCGYKNDPNLITGDNMVKCNKKGCEKYFVATLTMTPAVEAKMIISDQDLKNKKFATWLKKRLP